MSEGNIENITKSSSKFAPAFVNHHVLPGIHFNGHCLINNNYIPKKVINTYISYTLNLNTDFTLDDCLFGSVKLGKNADLDKYKYNGYGVGFDSRSEFLFTDRNIGNNFIIFWIWYELTYAYWE